MTYQDSIRMGYFYVDLDHFFDKFKILWAVVSIT